MRLVYRTQKGFTLVETIVTLVVSSICATMLFAYMQTVSRSTNNVGQLQDIFALQQSMENIVSDYNAGITACAPSCTSAVLTHLQTNINNKVYGSYTVNTNSCFNLTTGTAIASTCTSANSVLEVVIKDNTTGATLGAVFTY